MIKKFFTPPLFQDDREKTGAARLLFQILMAGWSLPILGLVVIALNPPAGTYLLPAIVPVAFTLAALMFLNRTGRTRLASAIMLVMQIILFTYLNYTTGGEPRPLLVLTVIAIMMSGLLLGGRAPLITALLLVAQHAVIVVLHAQGLISVPLAAPAPAQNILVTAVSYVLIAVLLRLAIERIQSALNQVRESEQNLQSSNRELQQLSISLEQRVAERTDELEQRSHDLESTKQQIERRAAQFEAIAQVTQSITSIRDLQELLPRITTVISEKFGFYHVGVFLLDEANLYAILSATNSDGGKRMMERHHRLRVGEQGIVGYVTATGTARIAMDVGNDAVFFDNPELPDTHSEIALPLTSGNRVIGALDVQSIERGAFTGEEVQLLGLLANQVGLAIENARLFDETRRALAEAEAISRQTTREAWSKLPVEQSLLGYRYTQTGSMPLNTPLETSETANRKHNGKQAESRVVVPIELRGETIGTLVIQSPSSQALNNDQMDLIRAVAERVAISAENARLFDETTRRAERERLVSDITGKIRSVNDPQSMIQTAMEELRKALGASRVEVVPQSVKGAE